MKLDTEIFQKFRSNGGRVSYYLFKDDVPIDGSINMPAIEGVKKKNKNTNSACFASINYELHGKWKDEKYNRIYFDLGDHTENCGPFNITRGHCETWINACKTAGLLPAYVPTAKVLRRKAIVLSLEDHTWNQIYIYLSVYRFLHDEPGCIGAALTLMEKGMHVLPALLLGSKVSLGNSNHHFLPGTDCAGYLQKGFDINASTIRLRALIGLHRLTTNKVDSRKKPDGKHGSGFNCNSTIANCTKLDEILDINMMFHPMCGVLASSKSDNEATMFLNVIKKVTKS